MASLKTEKNPVIDMIGDIEIKKVNYLHMSLNEHEYRRLVLLSLKTGLAVAKIIALSAQPCCICGNEQVTLTIPLGLLSIKKLNSGIIMHERNNSEIENPKSEIQ